MTHSQSRDHPRPVCALVVLIILVAALLVVSCVEQTSVQRVSSDQKEVAIPQSASQLCVSDSDCVPAGCCHSSSCVHLSSKPACAGILCTMECRPGTLDCGQGSCVCKKGSCIAVISSSGEIIQ